MRQSSYWQKFAWASLIGACTATACVVSTTDNTTDGGSSGSSGASGASGSASGGASGASGASGSSGVAGTAGDDGGPLFVCDDETPDGTVRTPFPNCDPDPSTPDDVCQVCIHDHCCTEFEACFAFDPGDQCGYGGPDGMSEIKCYQDCIIAALADGGIIDSNLKAMCDGNCKTPSCGGSIGGNSTSDLAGCLHTNCETECFTGG